MQRIINHFTDDDLYKFTMCCAVIDNYPRAQVKYSFADRNATVYPPGFAEAVSEQVRMLEEVTVTEDEIDFMKRSCPYIPHWFYTFLRGYRYNHRQVTVSQDEAGHLAIGFEGSWSDTILLEVKVLAIVAELYYRLTGIDRNLDYEAHYRRTYLKGERLLEAGCSFSDMGMRRRASYRAQDVAVKALKDSAEQFASAPGRFVGTSNVHFAMKYGLKPIGTMAHEIVAAIAGMYGPQMANHIAMNAWRHTYRGALGTYLYDTYGWRIFSLNFSEDFACMFKGLRVDSGNNLEQMRLIEEKYRSLGIDPRTKQIVFSNGLNTDEAIALQRAAQGRCIPSFGIGTHFTNDFPGVTPMNIVIKLIAAKITESWPFYNDTCKLSEDAGKYTSKPEVVKRFLEALHLK